MKRIHVHLGVSAAFGPLLRSVLRVGADLPDGQADAEDAALAYPRFGLHEHDFAPAFRSMIGQFERHGVGDTDACIAAAHAARLFQRLGARTGRQTVHYAWDEFAGPPLAANGRVLCHATVSAYWFDRYLGHLAPRFSFVVRNQADLMAALYAEAVHKTGLQDDFATFFARFAEHRDLSWLPVVEPFVMRFGAENVQVVPYEAAEADPAAVLYEVLGGRGGRAPVALRAADVSGLLPEGQRAEILRKAAVDNAILFDRYIDPRHSHLARRYRAPKAPKSVARSGLDRLHAQMPETQVQTLRLTNINGQRRSVPLVQLTEAHMAHIPEDLGARSVLSAIYDFAFALPRGEPIRVRFRATRNGVPVPGIRLYLYETIYGRISRRFDMETRDQIRPWVIIRSDSNARYMLLLSHDAAEDLDGVHLVLDASEQQKVPKYVAMTDSGGLLPGMAEGAFASHVRPLRGLPAKVSGLTSVSSGEPVVASGLTAPDGPRPFFLTIDTESIYFPRPVMMTGEGLAGARGAHDILDALDTHNLRAVFYFNVYEHLHYADDCVERLCKTIHERGHEVALHCHKTETLDFYRRDIESYDYDGQRRIIEYGKTLLYRWLGDDVVNFRAGGHRHNADTLRALDDLGFRIDSSYLYGRVSLPAHKGRFVQPYRIGGLIEVPVFYLPMVMPDGLVSNRIFDINAINLSEALAAVDLGAAHMSVFNYMMHSFSFIARQRFKPGATPGGLLMRSPPLDRHGRFMGVTGLREDLFTDFCRFLAALAADKRVTVQTMTGALDRLEHIVDGGPWPEAVPVLYR